MGPIIQFTTCSNVHGGKIPLAVTVGDGLALSQEATIQVREAEPLARAGSVDGDEERRNSPVC